MRPTARRGFSLIEVLLASTILLLSAVVLAELATVGTSHARAAQQMATAQMLCQAKMNELLAGAAYLQSVEDEPFEGVPGWLHSVEVASAGRLGLTQVRVTVMPEVEEGRPARRFSLTRWMRADRVSSAPSRARPSEAVEPPFDPVAEPFDPADLFTEDFPVDDAWLPPNDEGWELP